MARNDISGQRSHRKHLANRVRILIFFMTSIFAPFILLMSLSHNMALASDASSLEISWTKSRKELHSSLIIPIKKSVIQIEPSSEQILTRIKNYKSDIRIDPPGLYFRDKNLSTIEEKAKLISNKGAEKELAKSLTKRIFPSEDEKFFAPITEDDLHWIDMSKLKAIYRAAHLKILIDGKELKSSHTDFQGLLDQTEGYLSFRERTQLKLRIKNGDSIEVDKDLLPKFARKRVGSFNIVRGPNCFQAALAFQNEKFPSLPYVNPVREEGYDQAMINYDELWTALETSFYEINPRRSELKYGDIIVFSDISKVSPLDPMNYRLIKHASAYLFGGLVFSKGSKSANTPYSIKHLDDEWKIWEKYSKELAVKVFRRTFKSVRRSPPVVKDVL